jgi:hypothetical protein
VKVKWAVVLVLLLVCAVLVAGVGYILMQKPEQQGPKITPSPTLEPSPFPNPSSTPSPTPLPTPSTTPTLPPTPTPSPSPTPTFTPTPSPKPPPTVEDLFVNYSVSRGFDESLARSFYAEYESLVNYLYPRNPSMLLPCLSLYRSNSTVFSELHRNMSNDRQVDNRNIMLSEAAKLFLDLG